VMAVRPGVLERGKRGCQEGQHRADLP
jgi:hypothetical protein